MKKPQQILRLGLLSVALVWSVQPTPSVQASGSGMPGMTWMATANWLDCDQSGEAPECADYRTPTGNLIWVTCCVPIDALGTSDVDACADGSVYRGRTEL